MKRDATHIPFAESCSYPIRAGNAVRPLVDGEPAFRRICEAVEAARHSVWVTVAFYVPAFQLPDGRGNLFDVLDRAVERGLDVRVIFWRHVELEQIDPGKHFSGTPAERAMLKARGSRFLARWDRAHGAYCQHQKSWLIDAGRADEVVFVGGINLTSGSMVAPGHAPTDGGNTHDVYVELSGPSASDVHHNFVQRWNEASDRDAHDGLWPDTASQDQMRFPDRASPNAGDAVVQIQRTVRRERYTDGTPTPGGGVFPIEQGETSIADQYLQAIDAAERTVYLEDQAIGSPQILDALSRALRRGVRVAFVVPITPNPEMAQARRDPRNAAFFDALGALGQFENFTLAGLATQRTNGVYQNVYVHAKIGLIDDAWCTIGSANVANRSFYGDTELNASIWHGPTVRALRRELFEEHLGHDTSALDDVAALDVFARVARENTSLRGLDKPQRGLALSLDPATYAS
ncbi:MAG: phosphatidylserine/phosphatidylglycerophosphate/cardiolipin synthase family protein [Chloroflexi bacterium]|nr:phosphatidylserine/phosphatidylglycerophosphate/cardiolipin synthase family protein [Chloroflexota bacterium]